MGRVRKHHLLRPVVYKNTCLCIKAFRGRGGSSIGEE